MDPCLPEDDPQPERRAARIAKHAERFRYNYEYFPSIALANSVPLDQQPSAKWIEEVAARVLKLVVNTAKIDLARTEHRAESLWSKFLHAPAGDFFKAIRDQVDELGGDAKHDVSMILRAVKKDGMRWVFEYLVQKAMMGATRGQPSTIEDIDHLFRDVPLPDVASSYREDSTFAAMRVQGNNPTMIRRVDAPDDRFPVDDAAYRATMGDADSLEAAGGEGRLYVADYSVLDGAKAGDFPNGQKYVPSPLALFAVPKTNGAARRSLRPVAIQVGQDPSAFPLVTPRDGTAWLLAKSLVQTADGIVHQAVTHLAETHFVTEPWVIAAERTLAANHPLAILLRPHFEGTLYINDAAHHQLTADGGGVDALLSPEINASRATAAGAVASWDFDARMLPAALEGRGVADSEALPDYPYRDDALLVWGAMHEWFDSYLRLYYADDAAVAADSEVQAWVAEVLSRDGGRLGGVGQDGGIKTVDYLVDVVTHVVFTASAQHAAVNFPQYGLMSYVPNVPLSTYRAPFTSVDRVTEEDYVAQLPTMDMAQLQMDLGYMLGSLHYTQLGKYPGHLLHAHFADGRVKEPLKRFHARLEEIESTIADRNRERATYEYLLPSRIPQSINI